MATNGAAAKKLKLVASTKTCKEPGCEKQRGSAHSPYCTEHMMCKAPGCGHKRSSKIRYCSGHHARWKAGLRGAELETPLKTGTTTGKTWHNSPATAQKESKSAATDRMFFAACMLNNEDPDGVLGGFKAHYSRKAFGKAAARVAAK